VDRPRAPKESVGNDRNSPASVRDLVEILRRGASERTVEDLAAVLDASGGTFVDYYRHDQGLTRTTAYDEKLWPLSVGAFAASLAEHEGEPGFGRVLYRFLTEVFVWTYHKELETVPRVMTLAARHGDSLRLLFEKLEEIEEERLSSMEEIDLRRVETALRFELSAQILALLGRDRKSVPEMGDRDPGGVYERVLEAIGGRMAGAYRLEVDRMLRERRRYAAHPPSGNLFTGEERYWIHSEEYLAEVRSLAEHLPESPGDPRISSEDFLGHFSAEQLKLTYHDLEDPYPSFISRKWLAAWLGTGRDPEAAAKLLVAFYQYPEQKIRSGVPPESWWNLWREAIAPLDPEVVREACHAIVWGGTGERISYHRDLGEFDLLDKLDFAAVYGASTVAARESCARLAAIVREPRKLGDAVSIAAARALERIGTREALNELQAAKVRVKNKNVLRSVEGCLGRLAERQGMDVDMLADLTAEDFGLGLDGARERRIGEYVGELRLSESGKVERSIRNTKTGKVVRSVPKTAREAAPEATREMAATAKKLREGYAIQKARLEAAMVACRTWKPEEWRKVFVENPLLNNLARRLVWCSGSGTSAMPDGTGAWTSVQGEPVEVGDGLQIAHPVVMEPGDLAAWRRLVVDKRVVQPFKQVFRQTYVPTPAEGETRNYSNRFAGHVLNHRRTYALLKERGWSGMYIQSDDEKSASKDHPGAMVRALFDHSGQMDVGNLDGSDWFVLDRVWFLRLSRHGSQLRGRETLPLAEVPPAIFSDTMRDVDLFVAAAGVGSDPDWEDWEMRRTREAAVGAERRVAYEREQAASAEQRAALLQELLATLGIEELVRLEGRFAVVRGRLADYRVHLGSGNVHTEPDGRYVCIVPERKRAEELYLPFEEHDLKTAEIISKLLVLSADEKIKDEGILRQIHG
jgi:hypothetical protein